MSDDILVFENIGRSFFGVAALSAVNLNVGRGRVLGLIGQNGAGKSTLMNIAGGVLGSDTGAMMLDGALYSPVNPRDAGSRGIAFIHQELNLFTNLSIAENIFIAGFPRRRWRLIDRAALRAKAASLLAEVNLDVAPDTLVEHLSPGERQLVEVAKALQLDAQLIIFDEPTTSLTARETARLFELIKRMKQAGKTIVYISHILADVRAIADDIAVLRDGLLVASGAAAGFSVARMINLMLGRDIEQLYPPRQVTADGEVLLKTTALTARGVVKNIDLSIRGGEVVGLFGLMGSGRTELARMLFGLDPCDSGEVRIANDVVTEMTPRQAIDRRMAFITENRREEGLMMNAAIAENIALATLPKFCLTPLRLIDRERMLDAITGIATALRIKSGPVTSQPVKSLSGGNQQKVVIAKWLLTEPSIFILDEPTRGIDVAAKYEIYSMVDQLAAGGSGVLFISSEIEEAMAMCDRIVVMSRGEIVAEFDRTKFSKEAILRAAFREQENAA